MTALAEIRRDPPDLVLADGMMPSMDGLELLRTVRADRRTRELPFLLLSARASEAARSEGLALGADDYLTKPFSARELVARIEAALKLQDVRRESLRKLSEAMEQMRLAFTAGAVGIWTFDVEAQRGWWSEDPGRPFGFPPGLFEGSYETSIARVHVEDRGRVTEEFYRMIETGEPFRSVFPIYDMADRVRWVDSRGTLCRDADGRPLRVVGAALDVTAQKESEDRLRRSSEDMARAAAELERYAHVVSHDLREPLQAVSQCLRLLDTEYRDRPLDGKADELVARALKDTVRMHRLAEDLLAYSAVDVGGRELVPVRSDEAFEEACRNLGAWIEKTGAVIERGILPTVRGVRGHLVRLFQNLVANALKYRSDRRPHISVGSEVRGQEILFCVRDNGIGFDDRDAKAIFELFRQLRPREPDGGAGIGLTACKRIVEVHGGRIWAEGHPDRGATIFFTLPRP